jgi:hypothetical protein
MDDYIAVRAALWGADQELEACAEWLYSRCLIGGAVELRNYRRPEPPTLKEQALKGFDTISEVVLEAYSETSVYEEYKKIADTVREALEAL